MRLQAVDETAEAGSVAADLQLAETGYRDAIGVQRCGTIIRDICERD